MSARLVLLPRAPRTTGKVWRDPPAARLFQFLIGGCVHRWADVKVVKIFAKSSAMPVEYRMRQRCEACGRFREISME